MDFGGLMSPVTVAQLLKTGLEAGSRSTRGNQRSWSQRNKESPLRQVISIPWHFVYLACVTVLDVMAMGSTIIEGLVSAVEEGVFVVIAVLIFEVLGHESLQDEQLRTDGRLLLHIFHACYCQLSRLLFLLELFIRLENCVAWFCICCWDITFIIYCRICSCIYAMLADIVSSNYYWRCCYSCWPCIMVFAHCLSIPDALF